MKLSELGRVLPCPNRHPTTAKARLNTVKDDRGGIEPFLL